MDYEKLIESICSEVCRRLQSMDHIPPKKKTAIVMWDNDKNHYSAIDHIFDIRSFEDRKQGFDIIIVANLCLRGLSTLALGTNVSEEERFILTSLLRGKKIYVLESGLEYRKYKETAPKQLYDNYVNYEEQLKNYGVKLIASVSDLLMDFQLEQGVPFEVKNERNLTNEKSKSIEKKLITEKDLFQLREQGIVKIFTDKSSIITPLAKDFIKNHHIIVEKNNS